MKVYTDGSVLPSGEGRLGFIVIKDNKIAFERVFSKVKKTTSNRMELSSVIATIIYLKEKGESIENLSFYTDSIYVINGVESLSNWVETNKIDTIKNKDLWDLFLKESKGNKFEFTWVKGHEKINKSNFNHRMNKRVDKNLKKL